MSSYKKEIVNVENIDRLINETNNQKGYNSFLAGKKLVEALSNNIYLSNHLLRNFPWNEGILAMKFEIVKHIQFGLSASMNIIKKTSNKLYFPYMEKIDNMLPEYSKIFPDYRILDVQLDLCDIACNALDHYMNDSSSEELSQAFNIVANIVNNASRTVQNSNSDVKRFNTYVESVNNVYDYIREYIGDDFEPSTTTTANKQHIEGGVAKLNPDILIRIGAYEEQNKDANKIGVKSQNQVKQSETSNKDDDVAESGR